MEGSDRYFVGMNKWGHDASACLLTLSADGKVETEIFLKERLTRNKKSHGPLEASLLPLRAKIDPRRTLCAETSYLARPISIEDDLAGRHPPFYDHLRDLILEPFYAHFNKDLKFVSHHRCHAISATMVSPFEKSVILVMDGAGNASRDFDPGDTEVTAFPPATPADGSDPREWWSVYLQDGSDIRCVAKEWQIPPDMSLGNFFSEASRYIFNSHMDSGKVMGLAPFGVPHNISGAGEFIQGLNWKTAFTNSGKEAWERSGEIERFAGIAASVQSYFEERVLNSVRSVRERFPAYENLILTGGCALNCVANSKIFKTGYFKNIYVPVFPGDESVSLGAAAHRLLAQNGYRWSATPYESQRGNFGPVSSIESAKRIREVFAGFRVSSPADLCDVASTALAEGRVVGWFQGRSESGPRALGSRSILASPVSASMRDHLNDRVKGRESFRPYGGSCLWERSHEYFDVPAGFESPFMSFAPNIHSAMRDRLQAICHVDGTSRIQTVRREVDPRFHELIRSFERKTGVACVLNTSMNVMGEPIVETLDDARRFFENTPVDALAVEDLWIERP